MTDMRHRDGKLKIMHTIIGDFGKVLRRIAALDEVDSVLTGTIAPSKGYQETLTFQYFTDNGLKLLARTTTAVQEIFIVTAYPDLLLDELQKMGFIESEREAVRHKPGKRKRSRNFAQPDREQKGESAATPRGKNAQQNDDLAGKESDPLTLKQRLNHDTLSALLKLKEEATPKRRDSGLEGNPAVEANKDNKKKPEASPKSRRKSRDPESEEDFAALFAPKDTEESFEELLNQSKLDPKFFK